MADVSLKSVGAKPKGGGRVMGLPTYVWLGVLAGGLLLGLYLRSRGSSTTAAPAVDTSSTPASIDSGDPFTGLSGSSVGGDTTASTDNGMSDLLNALGVQSQDSEALVQQEAGLTDALNTVVANLASSGGSGAGHGKPKVKAHHKPATKKQQKHTKQEHSKNKKVKR